jgi:hypothetical protein
MTTHTIRIAPKAGADDPLEIIDQNGDTQTLTPGTDFTTDDAEVAAIVADSASRQVGPDRVAVETIYDDDEPAATSLHTGAQKRDFEAPPVEEPSTRTSKAKSESGS